MREVVAMVERLHLGWRVDEDVWDAFERHVEEKHGVTDGYLRFELELAMREYLDEDDLLETAESLLREHTDLSGLSSSTDAIGIGVERYGGDTRPVQHRVNADLKERFQKFATKHDAGYGHLLSAALDSYSDGGRARRIIEDVEQLITDASALEGQPASVESDATDEASVDVDPKNVVDIADALPSDCFPERQLEQTIVRVVGNGDSEAVDAYRNTVLEQIGADEHPHKEGVYITDEFRESRTIYADLELDQRIALLRRYAAADAAEDNQSKRAYTYKEVQELFEVKAGGGAPSHQYAYDLMEYAADEPGFTYSNTRGQLQLRVNLQKVSGSIRDYALEQSGGDSVRRLSTDTEVTSYVSGPTPAQEAAADD